MATRTITTQTDDLDGSEPAATITFALEGTSYEIDLSEEHATQLREALAGYIAHARKANRSASAGTARRSTHTRTSTQSSRGYDAKAVRAWAADNDITVPGRGRIPGAVLEQYRAAGH